MHALADLYQTARQLRSFGITGDIHIPASQSYAQSVLDDLGMDEAPGAGVQVEFATHGTVILDIQCKEH